MKKPTLVITGAAGQLGRRVSELLLQKGGSKLILVTRQPEKLQDLAAHGADVRFGDFDTPESLVRAFKGGERLLLVSTTDLGKRVQQHLAALTAAAAANLRHVVYTSMLSPDPRNPAVITASHLATEQAVHACGLEWTLLRNSLYADYQVPEAQHAIATGRLQHNRGDGRIAYVSREDCAAVAAAVLSGEGHSGQILEVTGPQAWSPAGLAELYGELGTCTVQEAELDDEAFIATLMGNAGSPGHARYGAELVASFGRAIREGWFAACTDTVSRLTGRQPLNLPDLLAGRLL